MYHNMIKKSLQAYRQVGMNSPCVVHRHLVHSIENFARWAVYQGQMHVSGVNIMFMQFYLMHMSGSFSGSVFAGVAQDWWVRISVNRCRLLSTWTPLSSCPCVDWMDYLVTCHLFLGVSTMRWPQRVIAEAGLKACVLPFLEWLKQEVGRLWGF